MMDRNPERLWTGVCVLEEVSIARRADGKSAVVLVVKEGGLRSLERFLRGGAAMPPPRPGDEGGDNGD